VHPLTGVPVAILSALLTAVGFRALADPSRRRGMDYAWGPVSLRALSAHLSESGLRAKMAQSRQAMRRAIASLLQKGPQGSNNTVTSEGDTTASKWQTADELKSAVVAQFEQILVRVIKDLTILEDIRKTGQQ
jgi:hypothetical protein